MPHERGHEQEPATRARDPDPVPDGLRQGLRDLKGHGLHGLRTRDGQARGPDWVCLALVALTPSLAAPGQEEVPDHDHGCLTLLASTLSTVARVQRRRPQSR